MTRFSTGLRLPGLPAFGGQAFRALPRRRLPAMAPEEEESLLRKVGLGLVSGLVRVGQVLDVPGSVSRGLLSGEPERAFKGILDPSKRVYGREMLQKWGMLGPNKPGFDWGDVAGFGAEVVTDPLFWVGQPGKALSQSGKTLKAAGLLDDVARVAPRGVGPRMARMMVTPQMVIKRSLDPKALAKFSKVATKAGLDPKRLLQQPVGGLLNVGPMGLPWATLGQGRVLPGGAVKVGRAAGGIAKGLDVGMGWLGATPPARFGKMLFDPKSMGLYGKQEQQLAQLIHPKLPGGRATAKMTQMRFDDELDEIAKMFDESFPQLRITEPLPGAAAGAQPAEAVARESIRDIVNKVVYHVGERPETGMEEAFGMFMPKGAKPAESLVTRVSDVATRMREANRAIHGAIGYKGGDRRWIEGSDLFQHMPRYADDLEKAVGETYLAPLRYSGMRARREPLRHIPREIVNQVAGDPGAWDATAGASNILAKYGKYLGGGYGGMGKPAAQQAHAQALTEWVQQLPQRFKSSSTELLSPNLTEALLRYHSGGHRVDRMLDAVHQFFNMNAGREGVPLADAFRRIGMNSDEAVAYFALSGKTTEEAVAQLRVPEDIVRAAGGVIELFQSKGWASKVGQAIDTFNRWFKQNVTLPFPAFWARNHNSGQFVNVASDIVDNPKDLAGYTADYFTTGGYWLKPKSVPKDLADELRAFELITHRGFEGVEAVLPGPAGAVPGHPWNVGEVYQQALRSVAPAAGEEAATGAVAAAGRQALAGYRTMLGVGSRANQGSEWMNRVTPYIYLTRRKGWTPEAAAAMVKRLQFDYGDLSPFERVAMKRLIPFWTFTRKMAGLLTESLWQRPGGGFAQSIRAATRAYDPGTLAPRYVQAGTAIPLKPGPSGHERYLTGMGLAHEDPLSYLSGGLKGAGYEFLSRTTPLVKWPLEATTGQSFFRRRLTQDLDPAIGRLVANVLGQKETPQWPGWMQPMMPAVESAAVNLPISRYLSTARVATDPRKEPWNRAMNLLTGFRVTDVSPASKEAVAREAVEKIMRTKPGARVYQNVYFPQEVLDRMPPEQRAAAEEMMAVMRILRERAKKRAAVRR